VPKGLVQMDSEFRELNMLNTWMGHRQVKAQLNHGRSDLYSGVLPMMSAETHRSYFLCCGCKVTRLASGQICLGQYS